MAISRKPSKHFTSKYHKSSFHIHKGQIFNQNPLLFIIQDCVNQRRALFYSKVFLCDNFWQFDESPGKYTSKTRPVETKRVCG